MLTCCAWHDAITPRGVVSIHSLAALRVPSQALPQRAVEALEGSWCAAAFASLCSVVSSWALRSKQRHRLLLEVALLGNRQLLMALEHDRGDERQDGSVVREDPDCVGAPADLVVHPLERVRGPDRSPVALSEALEKVGDLLLGFGPHGANRWQLAGKGVDHLVVLGAHRVRRWLKQRSCGSRQGPSPGSPWGCGRARHARCTQHRCQLAPTKHLAMV